MRKLSCITVNFDTKDERHKAEHREVQTEHVP